MRKPPSLLAFSLVIAALLTGQTANPSSGSSTRLLRMPTVSATQIAFAYANNLWVVERSGGKARRLTSFAGQTTNPHFSPDGKWIAFSGEYAGNVDVYIVPSYRAGLRMANLSSSLRRAIPPRPVPRRAFGRCPPKAASKSPWLCLAPTRVNSPRTASA